METLIAGCWFRGGAKVSEDGRKRCGRLGALAAGLLAVSSLQGAPLQAGRTEAATFVHDGKPASVTGAALDDMRREGGALVVPGGKWQVLYGGTPVGGDGYEITVRLSLDRLAGTGAAVGFGGDHHTTSAPIEGRDAQLVILDGPRRSIQLAGRRFLPEPAEGPHTVADAATFITPGRPFDLRIVLRNQTLAIRIDDRPVYSGKVAQHPRGVVGLLPYRNTMRVAEFSAAGHLVTPELEHTDLWTMGVGPYHSYRIPTIVATKSGTLLAFIEGRNPRDHPLGDVDVLVKRSSDGGRSWSDQQLVWDAGPYRVSDPSPVVDRTTGRVFLIVQTDWAAAAKQWPPNPDPGNDHRYIFALQSDDDGRTWSKPRDLSRAVLKPEWRANGPGPVAGIQLSRPAHRGRLVMPMDHETMPTVKGDERSGSHSHVIYSDDHGATWQLGGSHDSHTNESTVVELSDGQLLQSMRHYGPQRHRAHALSRDGGETWGKKFLETDFPHPVNQGALLRYSWPEEAAKGGKSRILYSGPADPKDRYGMTVRLSEDEGETWPVAGRINDAYGAYSGLVVLPDNRIGLLYERDEYRRVSFVSFSLEWLTDGRDTLPR